MKTTNVKQFDIVGIRTRTIMTAVPQKIYPHFGTGLCLKTYLKTFQTGQIILFIVSTLNMKETIHNPTM